MVTKQTPLPRRCPTKIYEGITESFKKVCGQLIVFAVSKTDGLKHALQALRNWPQNAVVEGHCLVLEAGLLGASGKRAKSARLLEKAGQRLRDGRSDRQFQVAPRHSGLLDLPQCLAAATKAAPPTSPELCGGIIPKTAPSSRCTRACMLSRQ